MTVTGGTVSSTGTIQGGNGGYGAYGRPYGAPG